MKQQDGFAIARRFQQDLRSRGYPVERVIVFGSVAQGRATAESDLDIAVVCHPFLATRHEENMALRRARRDIDIRIEPICFHPDEFGLTAFPLAQEVARTGIEVRAIAP